MRGEAAKLPRSRSEEDAASTHERPDGCDNYLRFLVLGALLLG